MKQIRLPQGMRDLTFEETEKKNALKQRVENVFASFGYREVETPTVEYLDTYANAYGDVKNEEMYEFFDSNGNTLALKTDMTVPIARVCATKYANAEGPFRFRYCSNVYKVRHMFAGQRSEVTDCGIELIGMDASSDVEVLTIACETMESFGVKEDYVIEIGNSGFFRTACSGLSISDEETNRLADLIDRKSLVELEQYLIELKMNEEVKSFFTQLPLLAGDVSVLDTAETISYNDTLKAEVQTLRSLYQQLDQLGYGSHIQFDFGKVPHLDYYTGIIFEGYVGNVASSVLSGGRYDSLLSKFGKDYPACGFSVKLDSLIERVSNRTDKTTTIYYPKGKEVEALQQAKQLRKEENVVLVLREGKDVEVER